MPPLTPNTGQAVIELVRKAELADDDVLAAFVQNGGAVPPSAADTATQLITAGVLTPFQARLILQGKYKGFRLGPYRILDQIGAGGMGQVYLAEHMRMHRRVALKVLPRNQAADPVEVERFYREARIAAALDHPNIVRAYDVDHEQNTHFLVMEYLAGETLLQRLASAGGVLSIEEACGYAIQAAAGLEHAHNRKLVHRDIHPSNLLVGPDGVVKILDMGIARFFHTDAQSLTEKHKTGVVMGTADYIAPEQAMGSATLDHRADIYSLGATLYHLVTGRPPFVGNTAAKLLAHQLQAVPPAHSVRPEVPEELSRVIEIMMAKEPDDRYASAEDVMTALLPFAHGSYELDGLGDPMNSATALSRRTWFLVAGLLALAIVGAVVVTVVAIRN